ncbi:MAG: hypothetical protein NZO16_07665 [Deltaproteobacteria bacterium]|nr:hypothetical protein [Deltaproteobacteria bacterium]
MTEQYIETVGALQNGPVLMPAASRYLSQPSVAQGSLSANDLAILRQEIVNDKDLEMQLAGNLKEIKFVNALIKDLENFNISDPAKLDEIFKAFSGGQYNDTARISYDGKLLVITFLKGDYPSFRYMLDPKDTQWRNNLLQSLERWKGDIIQKSIESGNFLSDTNIDDAMRNNLRLNARLSAILRDFSTETEREQYRLNRRYLRSQEEQNEYLMRAGIQWVLKNDAEANKYDRGFFDRSQIQIVKGYWMPKRETRYVEDSRGRMRRQIYTKYPSIREIAQGGALLVGQELFRGWAIARRRELDRMEFAKDIIKLRELGLLPSQSNNPVIT